MATPRRRRPPRGSRGLTPRPRARLHLLVPAHSLTRARAPFSPPPEPSLELRPRRARSSAGVELSRRRAISRLLAPAAPPRLPSAHARACAAFRALGELPRASPPTSMAPPCSAAVERPLPPFLSRAWLPARFRHCLAHLLRSFACAAVAGDGRRPLAEPRRRASARPGEAPCLRQPGLPGRKQPWAEALPGRRAPLFARSVWASCGRGPAVPHGPAQYFLNELISIYYLLIEI